MSVVGITGRVWPGCRETCPESTDCVAQVRWWGPESREAAGVERREVSRGVSEQLSQIRHGRQGRSRSVR